MQIYKVMSFIISTDISLQVTCLSGLLNYLVFLCEVFHSILVKWLNIEKWCFLLHKLVHKLVLVQNNKSVSYLGSNFKLNVASQI
jgi:hypothetical protein